MELPKAAHERFVDIMREQRAKAAAIKSQSFKAVATSDTDLGVIIGIGAAVGSPTNLDLDGEFIEKADLFKMCFDFTGSAKRTFKANHKDGIDCTLVMSWAGAPIVEVDKAARMLEDGEAISDDMKIVGISLDVSKATHWFVGVKPNDPEILEAAKAGEIVGFSWAGFVTRTEV